MPTPPETLSPEFKAYLESDVLHLPDAHFLFGGMYSYALREFAAPIVERMAQLSEVDVVRINPQIAKYSSNRGGRDLMYATAFKGDLAAAISDLARAAGLNIAVEGLTDGISYQYPEHLAELLNSLKLPPTLQKRIEARKVEVDQELQLLIEKSQKIFQTLVNPESNTVVSPLSLIRDDLRAWLQRWRARPIESTQATHVTQPEEQTLDYTLKIAFDFDQNSYAPEFQAETHSYQRLNHSVTLVPPKEAQQS